MPCILGVWYDKDPFEKERKMIPVCLTPNCSRPSAPALKWGLCMPCHSKAKAMITSGVTTHARLVELGLALPADEGSDPFTEAFNKLTKKGDK